MKTCAGVVRAITLSVTAAMAMALLPSSCGSGYHAPPVTPELTRESQCSAAQLQRGYQLHQQNCANCHSFQNPAAYPAARLEREILPTMARKAGLSPSEAQDVLAYLLAARHVPPLTPH